MHSIDGRLDEVGRCSFVIIILFYFVLRHRAGPGMKSGTLSMDIIGKLSKCSN